MGIKFTSAARFVRDKSGVAAIEMGLAAPFLIAGLIMMLDAGLAVNERMKLDRNVRAGVQAVMARVTDPTAIKNAVENSTDGATNINVAVNQVCSCGSTVTACTNWCGGNVPPSVVIFIKATKQQTSLMLPNMTLESDSHVQLR
jgi:Flp pilus assembly protein TadG